LKKVFAALRTEPLPVEERRALSELSEEEFDKALEKLEIHGGARVDFGGAVTKGASGWQKSYTVQAQYRAEQFEMWCDSPIRALAAWRNWCGILET